MARAKTIQIAALNIAMLSPHSSEKYTDFIFDAFRLKDRVSLSKTYQAMIGFVHQDPSDKTAPISGEIYKFMQIDPNQPWFDEQTKEPATESEKNKIHIPEHLLPNFQNIPFVFLPKKHRLFVVTKNGKNSMVATTVKRIFDLIFGRVVREKNYPEVSVTIVPSEDSVEKILNIYKLTRLTIELTRPNADDAGKEEEMFMKRLENLNASKIIQVATAPSNEGLSPDDEMNALAKVASSNGKVAGQGFTTNGEKISISTDEIPYLKNVKVAPTEDVRSVLNREAQNWDN